MKSITKVVLQIASHHTPWMAFMIISAMVLGTLKAFQSGPFGPVWGTLIGAALLLVICHGTYSFLNKVQQFEEERTAQVLKEYKHNERYRRRLRREARLKKHLGRRMKGDPQ